MGIAFWSLPSPTEIERVMIFIDAGYLEKEIEKFFNIHPLKSREKFLEIFKSFLSILTSRIPHLPYCRIGTIRTYYYSALKEDENDEERKEQKRFFEILESSFQDFEVRLGRLIKTKDGWRQKGVDVLLAGDMITKAFLNHYDICVLVAGDDDYLDAIKIVKEITGKKIVLVYSKKNVSKRLELCVDNRVSLEAILQDIQRNTK